MGLLDRLFGRRRPDHDRYRDAGYWQAAPQHGGDQAPPPPAPRLNQRLGARGWAGRPEGTSPPGPRRPPAGGGRSPGPPRAGFPAAAAPTPPATAARATVRPRPTRGGAGRRPRPRRRA